MIPTQYIKMLKYHHIHSETSHYLYTYLSFLQLP